MVSVPSPSQLLRDLDSCNSDPVAVASCFVERVRMTGSLPPPVSGIGEPNIRGHLSTRHLCSRLLGGWDAKMALQAVRDGKTVCPGVGNPSFLLLFFPRPYV